MITRRHLVGAGALGAAALAMPRMAFAAEQADVVIVGAGLSGLHSAELLSALGMRVVVLEAGAQVGGRVQTVQTADGPIDVGASQIGRSYARVLDAVRRHGLELIPEDRDLLGFGAHLQDTWVDPADWENNPLNGTVGDERAINPILMGQAVMARHNPLKEVDEWLDPRFSASDISLRQLMQREGYSEAAIELAAMSAPGIGIDETSMLRMWQEATRGSIDRRVESAPAEVERDHPFGEANDRNLVDGLASISNIVGGCQKLPLAMAAKLGDAVRTGKRVAAIDMNDAGASVSCTDGSVYKARFVISALPFTVLRNIAITASSDNPLQRQAISTMPYANTARMYLTVEKPFWKEDGLPASFSSDGPIGMFWGIDNHTGEGQHRAMIVMVGKVAQAISRMQHEEAEAFVQSELVRMRPAAKGLLRYQTYKDWARDPNQLGCGFSLAPGQVNAFARTMTDPWQVMHFAGEHTRRLDFGMESAMESGERVAIEIGERA
ncbi:FAD-dependent oxidoreductase [Novosphingobium sp. YJ-S2-02]|uniref:FAD-dependent oxidoreductase n=1 Tax=Novosphingobium aureum TaxID=2792964 RepID=A0A931MLF4_9SPHN|nr:NAD(P)/FAD-dependent oxidoreductase [Novosphingobium aureum]MBH0113365.1 FAD-dependent oxidoreductase [Novosphingobium aureum]